MVTLDSFGIEPLFVFNMDLEVVLVDDLWIESELVFDVELVLILVESQETKNKF